MRFAILALLLAGVLGCDDREARMRVHLANTKKDLSDPDPIRRAMYASMLGFEKAKGKVYLPLLQESLKDESLYVRVQAAIAMCRIDPDQAATVMPVLTAAVDGPPHLIEYDGVARNLAILELPKLGPIAESAIGVLKKRLSDHPYTRTIAAAALAQIDKSTYDTTFPILAEGLRGGQSERIAAAQAFCKLGDDAKEFMPSVRKLLDGDDRFVRSEVEKALQGEPIEPPVREPGPWDDLPFLLKLLAYAVPVGLALGLVLSLVMRYCFPSLLTKVPARAPRNLWWLFAFGVAMFAGLAAMSFAGNRWSFGVYFIGFTILELHAMVAALRGSAANGKPDGAVRA
jgi:hypothetical protein